MEWRIPPILKVYEALGCIADKRIEIDGNEAKVHSSSKGKFYTVIYDEDTNSIMANDNGSYWKNYLGYPAIAFLMLKGIIKYNKKYEEALKGIVWKDMTAKFKNDTEKAEEFVFNLVKERGFDLDELFAEIETIYNQIKELRIEMLGDKMLPPEGY
jgi:hypothetical protein